MEDQAFLRVGEKVFFERPFLHEIPKLQILKCYFADSYLLSMEQILPDKYTEALAMIKNWPKMRGREGDVFKLIIIKKMDKHFRETGMDQMNRAERVRVLKNHPLLSKDCLRKTKNAPLSEFELNILAMEFSLRERFSLGSSSQKGPKFPGDSESEKLVNAEKFMKQYMANVYSQYGHFIFHYAP